MERRVRENEEGVLQRGSHRPAVRCMAEAHHSANYDQAFPCRHSSTGNGKSLFSHTPMEAMGHGAMQMRCLYTHIHSYTDTHKHQQVCNVINTTCTHCAYSHTLILVYRAKNTHNHHSHHSSHVAMLLYIPPNTNINLYLSPSLLNVQRYTHIHTQMNTDSRDHTHACRQRKSYTSILRFSFSPRTHQNIMWIPSIKFAPTEPSYLYLLQNTDLKGSVGVFNHKSEEIYIQRQLQIAKR